MSIEVWITVWLAMIIVAGLAWKLSGIPGVSEVDTELYDYHDELLAEKPPATPILLSQAETEQSDAAVAEVTPDYPAVALSELEEEIPSPYSQSALSEPVISQEDYERIMQEPPVIFDPPAVFVKQGENEVEIDTPKGKPLMVNDILEDSKEN